MPETIMTVTAPGRWEFRPFERRRPASDEVSGRTLYSVVSPGTELAVSAGSDYGFPLELGYAAVLQVDAAGSDVRRWSKGDLALSMGSHATWQRRPDSELVPLPGGLDPVLAPFARLMHIPLSVLATSRVEPGARVGVAGLGVIGQLAVRVALAGGFEVFAADADAARRRLVPGRATSTDRLPEDSLDLVIECSGHEDSVLASADALRTGGELALAGVPWRARTDIRMHELSTRIFHRYLTVRSGWEWQVPWSAPEGEPSIPRLLAHGLALLADGRVDVGGLATTIAPSQLPAAYSALQKRRAPALTYLVDWSAVD